MTDATTAQILAEAERTLLGSTTDYYQPVSRLLEVIRRQDARIAALEAARAPEGQVPSKEAVEAFAAAARYWANHFAPHEEKQP